MKYRDFERILLANGFEFVRQKGSHRHFRGYPGGKMALVTLSSPGGDDIRPGTLKSMIRQSELPERLFQSR